MNRQPIEYKVTRNGKVWNDRFNNLLIAEENAEECSAIFPGDVFEVSQMTDEEIEAHDNCFLK